MTPEVYLDALLTLPAIFSRGSPVSRDRRWVAWTWRNMGPAADVFAAPTDGSSAPVRLSDTPDNTYFVSWVPDNAGVIVAQDRGGDERFQLFRIDLSVPTVMHALTEVGPDFFLRGGDLHPNGRYLVYGANYDVEAGQEIESTWIYRHDLDTGQRTVLAQPEKGGYIVPSLSSDGNLILYSRLDRHPAGRQIWLVDIEGKADREIFSAGDDVKAYASWFPDAHKILLMVETETHRKLGVMDLTGADDGQVTWLLDDPQRNIEDAYVPYGSDEIVIIEVAAARIRASLLDAATGQERHLALDHGNLIPLAPYTPDVWIALAYSSTQPEDIGRFSVDAPTLDRAESISRVWDQTTLTREDFTQAEDYHWASVDGLAIQGYLYRPKGQSKGTIVYVHGGPTAHSQDRINKQIQLYVRYGFTVLDPNYRGSTGFGLPFQQAIKEDGWGGREQVDIRAGIEHLIAEGLAEAGKVGITGTSYGGYSTWWAITHVPKAVVAAAAPICGMTDLVVDYESTRPDLRPYSEEMIGGSPDDIPETYAERSPINFVENIEGALLIVQGARDPNVSSENVQVVRTALDRAGVAYEVLSFEDEGHGISKPKNQKILYLTLLAFFTEAFGY
jgi:dipeptidyl aminopeptidase/acylaminoacyl peptidase